MGFIQFLGRHLGAAIFGALGVILLVLGYADQAKDILTGFAPWQLQAGGAALFVIAVVMILYKWDQEHRGAVRPPAPLAPPEVKSPSPLPSPPPSLPSITPPREVDKKGRAFVGESVTIRYLFDFFEEHTAIQGDAATRRYIGMWMRISGKVNNVRGGITGKVSVSIDFPELGLSVVQLYFGVGQDTVATLQRGDNITAIGEIESIGRRSIVFENCELIS